MTIRTKATNGLITLMIGFLGYGCPGNITKPDEAPIFVNATPTIETTITKMGETHTVRGTAEDPDGDSFQYKTLKDGIKVNDTNEYTFTIDKKGITKIDIIAYNDLSDTLTRNFSAENQTPIATNPNITLAEEESTTLSNLDSDPDGDSLTRNITSTSNVNANFNSNGQLEITGLENYFGTASVNYRTSDGNASSNGIVSINFTNTADDPIANAGSDKNGLINQEITLQSSSTHPDSPLSNIVDYQWRLLNGTAQLNDADLENAKLIANTKGEYEIELKVTDDKGATDTDTVKVNINSYSFIVNATNVLDDTGVGGLEVVLNGQSAITDANGRAEIEFASPSVSGNFLIKDEDVDGVIGDYFNFSDDVSVGTGLEVNVEMVPNLEFESQYYDSMFDMMTQLRGSNIIGRQPGDWPQDYPVLVYFNRDEMRMNHYNQASEESIQHINDKLGWEV
ncbi:MAG: Ig-like domain-containing protein, partial [archaeon]